MSRASEAIEQLLAIMARLRGPAGCPWDQEQTLQTLRPYLLEETYEVLEALESGNWREHCEELGDLLLQVVFQAQLTQELGQFEFADVAEAISSKLVSRHPHVFKEGKEPAREPGEQLSPSITDAEGVMRQWVTLKKKEKEAKGGGHSVLEGVPREMPALARAERLTEKASRIGFDWPQAAGARAKIDEELGELDQAIASGSHEEMEHELGDLLFAIANLARKLSIPPEEALRRALSRFIYRFQYIEGELARRGIAHGSAPLEELDQLWNEAKSIANQGAKSY